MSVRHPVDSLDFPGKTIWLYLGDRESQLGQIIGVLAPAPRSRPKAMPEGSDSNEGRAGGFRELEEAMGVGWGAAVSVVNVFVHHSLENRGYGIDLYESLAREAYRRYDAPIVSSACFGATISADARRTWNSKRLAERLTVRGLCACPSRREPGGSDL